MDRESLIEDVFEQARGLNPKARAAILDEACRDDAALREELEQLLEAHDTTHSLLDHPLLSRLWGEVDDAPERWIGRCIDGYVIKRHVATGGMGIVFEAEHQEGVRRVAIKLLRTDLTSRHAIRRFIAEVEILTSLEHPGIARIEAHGVIDDRGQPIPYSVMELIPNARSITAYAEEFELPIADRLTLFLDVCRAVSHAHECGIIHRDLKLKWPTNGGHRFDVSGGVH